MSLRPRNKVSVEFSMASMTDIVFLLLIFFMLTSTLVTTNALDLVLPSSKAKSVKKESVSVSITKDLRYFINMDPIEPAFMETTLAQRLNGQEDQVIVLRVEQGVPIEHAVEVMDIAYRNHYKIVLATKPK
jgi:biopolymer transport protein ExbD